MAGRKRYASHDEYFDSIPPEVRPIPWDLIRRVASTLAQESRAA